MSRSINIRVSGAHVRHASLRGSLLATFSVSILLKMLLISGALMARRDYQTSLFDILPLVTAKHPKIALKCGDRKQI